MPRPLLNKQNNSNNSLFTDSRSTVKQQSANTDNLTQLLRRKRSKEYMAQVAKLDSGQGKLSKKEIEDVVSSIQQEFPEVNLSGIFLGIVAKCYLGDNFEVHTLDTTLEIVNHFRRGESLPNNLEKARTLANNPNYLYIEVYSDCCRCIDASGNVATVKL